jgi:hypothetical protein
MNQVPELPSVHVIAFWSERELSPAPDLPRILREHLQASFIPERRLLAVSTLTGPADFHFAQAALDLGLPLIVSLPFPREEMKRYLPESAASDFESILAKAVRVEVVPSSSISSGALGQKLVDDADVLLAWFGGGNNAGDPPEIVGYATYRGRPVIALRPGAGAIEVRKFEPENEITHPRASVDSLQKRLGATPPEAKIPEELLRYFQACDEAASHAAPQVRRHFLNIVLANATASMAGSVASSFPQTPVTSAILNLIKFGCVLLGLGIFLVLRHRQSQNRWLDWRLRAELCRSAIATWFFPRAIRPLPPEEVPDLRDLIHALQYFHAVHAPPAPIPLDQFKADYGNRRLLDQLNYFKKQADGALKLGTWMTPFYWVFTCAALGTAAGSFFYQTVFGHTLINGTWLNFLFNFIPATAPALASWFLAFQAIQSVGRRRARFREMERLMHQALLDLTHCQSEDEVYHLVKRSEKLLLNEVLEWYSFVKYGR